MKLIETTDIEQRNPDNSGTTLLLYHNRLIDYEFSQRDVLQERTNSHGIERERFGPFTSQLIDRRHWSRRVLSRNVFEYDNALAYYKLILGLTDRKREPERKTGFRMIIKHSIINIPSENLCNERNIIRSTFLFICLFMRWFYINHLIQNLIAFR